MFIDYVEDKVFSKIKTTATESLVSRFPDIFFTTSSSTQANPKFPNVYVQALQGRERAKTLDGKSLNGGLFTFQIEVADNKSRQNTRVVMEEIVEIMVSMGFEVNGFPSQQDTDVYRRVARFQRLIGTAETL